MNSTTKRCLNCGNQCQGSFCSNCGQPTQVSEDFNRTTFFNSVTKSIARMTPGFWNTLIGLSFNPWVVMREYLHGKRAKYSEPVTMLIQLILYFTFLYAIVEYFTGIDFIFPDQNTVSATVSADDGTEADIVFNNFMETYPLLFQLVMSCIVAFSGYVIYRKRGSRPHNIYEFLVAAIYFACTMMIYDNILSPIDYFFPDIVWTIEFILFMVLGTVSIFKTFKIKPMWKAVSLWLLFILLTCIVTIVLTIIVTLTVYFYHNCIS